MLQRMHVYSAQASTDGPQTFIYKEENIHHTIKPTKTFSWMQTNLYELINEPCLIDFKRKEKKKQSQNEYE